MKKYTLFLAVFSFILISFLSFNVNSASAEDLGYGSGGLTFSNNSLVEGCTATSLFNTNTGLPCGNISTDAGCAQGNLFSSLTGRRCTGVSSSSGTSSGSSSSTVNSSPTRLLTIGSRGSDVIAVQQILKEQNYSLGTIDGVYGKRTARAVSDFQYDNDLAITGNVDANTLAKLNTFVNAIYPPIPLYPQPTTPIPPTTTYPPSVSEQVKCVFNGTLTNQNCYGYLPSQQVGVSPISFSCVANGLYSCVATVKGLRGAPVSWGSSCGGSANTTIDGNNEEVNFSCASGSPLNGLGASLLNSFDDKASTWYNFKPGPGTNGKNSDWNWQMTLTLGQTKKIQSISLVHANGYEGWSTSSAANIYGKAPYPLVVVNSAGVQLNNVYDQSFSPSGPYTTNGSYEFPAGTYNLKLYGQMETSKFSGGKLTVTFTDGTTITTDVPASNYTQ